tara:strand:- start:1871 stop:2653 length:783 start_codon:yes stop_codon:yes gene_type:complete
MNLTDWNDNKKTIEDILVHYCLEERIEFNASLKQMFNNLFDSYPNKVSSSQELKEMNKYILRTFINNIKANKVKKNEKPVNIYTRDDIIKERNQEINNKFNSVKEDFETFNVKKPPKLDFSDKVEEDNVSIDKKIEEELKNRQYDVIQDESVKKQNEPIEKQNENRENDLNINEGRDEIAENNHVKKEKKVTFDENSNTLSHEIKHNNAYFINTENKLDLILNSVSELKSSIDKLCCLLSENKETDKKNIEQDNIGDKIH